MSAGVTFLEVIIVIVIFAVLTLITLGLFFTFIPGSDVAADVEKIESVLRLARSRTLASQDASSFGVHMGTDRVVLFEGAAYVPGTGTNEITELSSRNEIYDISLDGGGDDVVFNRLVGTTDQFGTVSLRSKREQSQTGTVYIAQSGHISSIPLPSAGESNRVSDARHVHFDLGWSIQNASTLEFYFPNVLKTEQQDMAPYFNADKSEFDVTYTVTINNETQEIRVHTHSLDALNTDLCIHRDRNNGENTQRVEVRIIDGSVTKRIAEYLADTDDTVQAGTYGGTMEIQ